MPARQTSTQKQFPKPVVPADYPLGWHKRRGRWIKKIAGKIHYFGTGSDPAEALLDYEANKDRLKLGLERQAAASNVSATVAKLVGAWLAERQSAYHLPDTEKGSISHSTYNEYQNVAALVCGVIGNLPLKGLSEQMFSKVAAELSDLAVSTQRRRKTIVRQIFTSKVARRDFNLDSDLIDFGARMDLESLTELKFRRTRKKGIVSAEEIRGVLANACGPTTQAAVLLGVNVMMNAKDVSDLRREDVTGNWLENIRQKKLTPRKMWLWPETIRTLQKAKAAANPYDRWLLTRNGQPLVKTHTNATLVCRCGLQERVRFRKGEPWECRDCGLEYAQPNFTNVKQSRVDQIYRRYVSSRSAAGYTQSVFSWLRGTASSIASEEGRFTERCIKLVMGQARNDVLEFYQNANPNGQLQELGEFLRSWLFPSAEDAKNALG